MPRLRIPRSTWLAVLALLGAGSLAYPLLSPATANGLLLLIGTLAVAATLVGLMAHRPAAAAPWWLLAGGLGLTVIGDLAYILATAAAGGTPSFPGPYDIPYLLGMSLLVAGGVGLARASIHAGPDRRPLLRRTLIDSGIVTTSGCLLLWLVVGARIVLTPGATTAEIGLGLAYPLLDVALLGALTAMVLGAGTYTRAQLLLFGAFAIQFGADVMYAIQETTGTYLPGGALDSGWMLTYTLVATAALHPSMAHQIPQARRGPVTRSRRHLLLLSFPIGGAWVGLLASAHRLVRADPDQFLLLLTGSSLFMSAIAGLLLWRVADTTAELKAAAQERDDAHARELAIAEVTTRLALADGVGAIRETVATTAGLVRSPEATVALWLPGDGVAMAERDEERIPLTHDPAKGWLLVRGAVVLDDATLNAFDRVASSVMMAIDRSRLADEVRDRERRFRSLVRHAPDAITVHDEHGLLTYASPAMGRIVGVSEDRLIGTPWRELLHPEDLPRVSEVDAEMQQTAGGTALVETRLRRHDGGWRWVESRMTNLLADPSVRGIVANHRDTTERQRLQRQLQHQATHDALTGLSNRRQFSQAVRDVIGRGSNAVVFLDLDRFKSINDRLGHTAGDRLLEATAERIREVIRPGDLPARLGGDEFAVLLRRAESDIAETVAQRILDAVSQPLTIDGIELVATASLGIAVAEGDDDWLHDLLHDADQAMYTAKREGRGRIVRYSAASRQQTTDRIELENDLRGALEHGGLALTYEPVVALNDGGLVGVNTVLGWEHPGQGWVPPATFLPIAARIGVLGTIADWAIREACWQARAWTELEPGFLTAVDLPATALHDGSFAEDTESVLLAAGLADGGLTLTVNADLLADHVPRVLEALRRLRECGIRLRLAGFGASSAPLELLRRADVDELELSAAFVTGLDGGPEDAAIAQAVIQLAQSFGLDTVARGVASDGQHRQLLHRRCRYAAGPMFGYPQSAERITELLRAPTLERSS